MDATCTDASAEKARRYKAGEWESEYGFWKLDDPMVIEIDKWRAKARKSKAIRAATFRSPLLQLEEAHLTDALWHWHSLYDGFDPEAYMALLAREADHLCLWQYVIDGRIAGTSINMRYDDTFVSQLFPWDRKQFGSLQLGKVDLAYSFEWARAQGLKWFCGCDWSNYKREVFKCD